MHLLPEPLSGLFAWDAEPQSSGRGLVVGGSREYPGGMSTRDFWDKHESRTICSPHPAQEVHPT